MLPAEVIYKGELFMKMSQNTKDKAEEFIVELHQFALDKTGISFSNKVFQPIRQRYQHFLHLNERADKMALIRAIADELGITVEVKKCQQ